MMIQEFIDRTGFEPTAEEYNQIEEAYYKFNGNKDEFCKAFVANNGEKRVYEARAEKIRELQSALLESKREARANTERLELTIDQLTAALEKEQEWEPYESAENVPQAKYDELVKSAKCGSARYMTDDEAKDWVAEETGFARERIRIVHELHEKEINRHHQVRRTGKMIDRRPIYCATDYHYIVFNVVANTTMGWELHDGELTQYFG